MLYKRLIQNYYEMYGSFDHIQFSVIGEDLLKLSDESGISLNEICYRTLGYEATDKISAEDNCKNRIDLLRQYKEKPTAELKKQINKVYGKTAKAVTSMLSTKSFGKNQYVFLMCYNHFRHCHNCAVDVEDMAIDFYGNLSFLRTMGDFKKLSTILLSNGPLLEYRQIQRGMENISGSICSIKKNLTDEQFTEICNRALQAALFGLTADLQCIQPYLAQLPMISFTANKLYLALLDVAAINGVTYKDMLAEIDINVPDQILSFERKGFAIVSMQCEGTAWVITDKSTEEEPLKSEVVI